jgi:RNA polymerase sigma factor (sigma-70 family)
MDERDAMAREFEAHREHLRAVAYRMLGSLSDADDAVQEAWLRFDAADVAEVRNLGGWLTTVVARLCLDALRARKLRPVLADDTAVDFIPDGSMRADPEREALLAESVGRALLVVLNRLGPVERIVFVLHEMFSMPFAEIAPVVGRSLVATKKIGSRARLRVHESPAGPEPGAHRKVVEAFLAAARGGDLGGLLDVLAPDVVRLADAAALPPGVPARVSGSRVVADEIVVLGRRSRFAEVALVDGQFGLVLAPRGRLRLALTFAMSSGRITRYEVVADPARLANLRITLPG